MSDWICIFTGRGFEQLMEMLPQERWAIAAMGLATIERALGVTVDFVRQRKMFGKTLWDMQNTQFKLAEVKTTAHVARVFVEDCMARFMEGRLDAATASMVKLWVTEAEVRVVSEYVEHYHCERNHQGIGNRLIDREAARLDHRGQVECRQRLGGLLRYYERAAA